MKGRGGEIREERERMSKCTQERRNEDHFTESQALMTPAGNMRSIC